MTSARTSYHEPLEQEASRVYVWPRGPLLADDADDTARLGLAVGTANKAKARRDEGRRGEVARGQEASHWCYTCFSTREFAN